MKVKIKKTKLIDKANAQFNYENCLEDLLYLFKPYFLKTGKLDLVENDFDTEIPMVLASLLDNKIAIEDNENAVYFCADDILARQVIVEKNRLIKFWGVIYWLETHHNYPMNKTQQDPFYAEFSLKNEVLEIQKMKFGDYQARNIDKIDWYEMELDWVYEFGK